MYRYSDRLSSLTAPENRFSSLLAQLRATGRPLLDLTISNPTQALADYPHSEISSALSLIEDFRYQPDPFGNLDARRAIITRLQKRVPGIEISVTNMALTASTSEAYALLFKLLANPGDEVLVPTPSYPLFEYLAQLEAVKLRQYRLRYDGSWYIDFESLKAAVSERARALILVNPNNPTGSFLQRTEFDQLREFAQEHQLPIISDEVFMDYAFGESAGRMITLNGRHDLLNFTLNGLSKAAGMPQMKLAWIGVNGPLAERERACSRLELILDTYLSVSAPAQLVTEALLAVGDAIQARIRSRIEKNLFIIDQLLANSPVHRLHSEGGWSAILRVPQILSEEEWITRLLCEKGVIVQPGYFFDMPGEAFLVVSLLTPQDELGEGLVRILELAGQI